MEHDHDWFKTPRAASKNIIQDLENTILDLRQELKTADRLRKNLIYNKIDNRKEIIRQLYAELNGKESARASKSQGQNPEKKTDEVYVLRDGTNNRHGDQDNYIGQTIGERTTLA